MPRGAMKRLCTIACLLLLPLSAAANDLYENYYDSMHHPEPQTPIDNDSYYTAPNQQYVPDNSSYYRPPGYPQANYPNYNYSKGISCNTIGENPSCGGD